MRVAENDVNPAHLPGVPYDVPPGKPRQSQVFGGASGASPPFSEAQLRAQESDSRLPWDAIV